MKNVGGSRAVFAAGGVPPLPVEAVRLNRSKELKQRYSFA